MHKIRTTITLDPASLAEARRLVGASSTSETVDVALRRLVAAERLRSDIAAYGRIPPTNAELLLGDLPVHFDLGDDDVEYEALYGNSGD